jgi:hypothetical protein
MEASMCTYFSLTAMAVDNTVAVTVEVQRITDTQYEDLGDEGCLALAQEFCDGRAWDFTGYKLVEIDEFGQPTP